MSALSNNRIYMLDIKSMHSALAQLEEERKIPADKIIEAIEQALAAAYKKDFGKKGQIIRCHLDQETGEAQFSQVKIVVDESTVRLPQGDSLLEETLDDSSETEGTLPLFNEEHHIMLDTAKIIKSGAQLEDEITFPLDSHDEFGRVAAQTAKQVIVQKMREAEKASIIDEYGNRAGEVVQGTIQKYERGMVYVDIGRAIGIIPPDEQIPGERYNRGGRIKVFLYHVDDSPRGVTLKLSRTHPKLIEALFASESPEVASGVVEIKAIAREAGSRTKMAVFAEDEHIDPVGSCVGQKGIRVTTVMSEIGQEKIDIIPWSADTQEYIANSLSPARIVDIQIDEVEHKAFVEVLDEHLSLAIGKGGQNVRLAAKLTGWKIEIKGIKGEEVVETDGETVATHDHNETHEVLSVDEEVNETLDAELSSEETVAGSAHETPRVMDEDKN
jgi:N utilization substance protein A